VPLSTIVGTPEAEEVDEEEKEAKAEKTKKLQYMT
jgi:hypothetical protein